MGRAACSILNALMVTSCLSAFLAVAEAPTPAQSHTALKSVSRREKYVFAATADGIFRASLETKTWERLNLVDLMIPIVAIEIATMSIRDLWLGLTVEGGPGRSHGRSARSGCCLHPPLSLFPGAWDEPPPQTR
jgi:hypothetical protein